MKIKPVQYIIITLIVVALLVSFKIYSDNREKSLDSIINYTPSNLEYLGINIRGYEPWNTNKQEPAKKLKTFPSQQKGKNLVLLSILMVTIVFQKEIYSTFNTV